MTRHTEDALAGPCISQVVNLSLAIPAFEAVCAKGLVAREYGKVFDFVVAGGAAVGAIVADEGAVAEKEKIGVGVEEGAAGVAAEAVNVPSVSGWGVLVFVAIKTSAWGV